MKKILKITRVSKNRRTRLRTKPRRKKRYKKSKTAAIFQAQAILHFPMTDLGLFG